MIPWDREQGLLRAGLTIARKPMGIAQILDLNTEMQGCIDNCLECHAICERTAIHCLGLGGEHASASHQTIMRDCAQICATCVDFMIRKSSMHRSTCSACAAICARCEQDCRRLAGGDEQMLKCADACARCSDSCRAIASS